MDRPTSIQELVKEQKETTVKLDHPIIQPISSTTTTPFMESTAMEIPKQISTVPTTLPPSVDHPQGT